MRVMVRKNVNVPDRISNGSTGFLRHWQREEGSLMPSYLIVEFDSVGGKPVGVATRQAFCDEAERTNHQELKEEIEKYNRTYKDSERNPTWVPIRPTEGEFRAMKPTRSHLVSHAKDKVFLLRGDLYLKRKMFPITVAFASTIHKMQVTTLSLPLMLLRR